MKCEACGYYPDTPNHEYGCDAQRQLEHYNEKFPCDGGCTAVNEAQEDCSRDGRSPRELWDIIDKYMKLYHDLNRRVSHVTERLEFFTHNAQHLTEYSDSDVVRYYRGKVAAYSDVKRWLSEDAVDNDPQTW